MSLCKYRYVLINWIISLRQATSETNYVYYTAIPRFCAVTTSNGNNQVVLTTSGSADSGGTLVNTVWTAPGTVVRAPQVPGNDGTGVPDSAVSAIRGTASTALVSLQDTAKNRQAPLTENLKPVTVLCILLLPRVHNSNCKYTLV